MASSHPTSNTITSAALMQPQQHISSKPHRWLSYYTNNTSHTGIENKLVICIRHLAFSSARICSKRFSLRGSHRTHKATSLDVSLVHEKSWLHPNSTVLNQIMLLSSSQPTTYILTCKQTIQLATRRYLTLNNTTAQSWSASKIATFQDNNWATQMVFYPARANWLHRNRTVNCNQLQHA